MKTFFSSLVAFTLAFTPLLRGETPVPGANTAVHAGLTIKDGVTYVIQNGEAQRLDESRVPPGQMLTVDGKLVTLPPAVTGFESSAGATASANPSAETSSVPAVVGITLRAGVAYWVRDGKAARVDAAQLPEGRMLSFDGQNLALPEHVTGLASTEAAGAVTPGKVTPGKVTPGRVTPGTVKGADVRGSDVRGADVKGSDTHGANVRGGDVRGGDVRGGDVRGGDVRGGDVRGGDVRGGDVRGGDVRGGDVRGGDVRGGDVRGGDVRGGDVSK